jgi:penicillin amidase
MAWDGSMDADGVAPTVYSAMRQEIHNVVIGHLFGSLADALINDTGRGAAGHRGVLTSWLVTMAENDDPSLLPPGTDWPTLIAEALETASEKLRQRLGDDVDSWTWSSVHHTRPRHPLSEVFPEAAGLLLDPPQVPMGGDGDTPQQGGFSQTDPYVMTATSVARYAFDLADWDSSAWVSPLGASGHPGSPHYADQVNTWAEIAMVPMLYTWPRIEAEAETTQRIIPE